MGWARSQEPHEDAVQMESSQMGGMEKSVGWGRNADDFQYDVTL